MNAQQELHLNGPKEFIKIIASNILESVIQTII